MDELNSNVKSEKNRQAGPVHASLFVATAATALGVAKRSFERETSHY
jgi:hypothetical protein